MLIRRLALAIGLLCGLIGTQGPEFAQQYRQRLAGAIDELSRIVATFDSEAASHSLAPDDAIARLKTNPDPLARERGADIQNDIGRLDRLKIALAAFKDSGAWRRLAALAKGFDQTTAKQTWDDFEPAIPTTLEACAVGLFGLIWGWAATHLFTWPIRHHLRRRRERRRSPFGGEVEEGSA
jgi:hypothetical protein